MSSFEEANQKVHKVEDEWHYARAMKMGFEPVTKEGIGFVRSYTYKHPNGTVLRCATGLNADYWSALVDGKEVAGGYWADLDKYVQNWTN
jgi:hypothetical protein